MTLDLSKYPVSVRLFQQVWEPIESIPYQDRGDKGHVSLDEVLNSASPWDIAVASKELMELMSDGYTVRDFGKALIEQGYIKARLREQ